MERYEGKEFDDLGDFLDAVAQTAGGFHGVYGSINDDPAEDQYHRIELTIPQELGDYLAGTLPGWRASSRRSSRLAASSKSSASR